ncbi:uncharacterized protein TRIADDRAFT_60392 [Trichoplax adhaerens]|uniref:Uncharacterized protein n=1 Tax=Trichoplax adhaerens TaxID=10228 RepID=B3S836_TRIAD|nr:predicted protein [Trichoplax adhaerens]EDV21127.1 predicted protein [Trichoplax adhaerens]|eukprot:XP_002116457.1 predicted protein [Trichoplax adhaerens]
MDDNEATESSLSFRNLDFHPGNDCIIMTQSMDKKTVKTIPGIIYAILQIWQIRDNQIQAMNKQNSYTNEIQSCQFIRNGLKLLLWFKNYEYDSSNKRKAMEWRNECQIEIWDVETWQCLWLFQVPDWVYLSENFLQISSKFEHGQSLQIVLPGGDDDTWIILAYKENLALVKLTNENTSSSQELVKHCKLLFEGKRMSSRNIRKIISSSDHHYLGISMTEDSMWIINVTNGEIESYLKITTPNVLHEKMFIPGTHHVLAYGTLPICLSNYLSLYEYNLDTENQPWRTREAHQNLCNDSYRSYLERKVYHKYCQANIAFANNIPFATHLIETEINEDFNKYQLKIYQGETLSTISCHDLDQEYYACAICDDFPSVFLFGRCECNHVDCYGEDLVIHDHLLITELIDILNKHTIPNNQKKVQYRFRIPDKIKSVFVMEARYRKRDETLIFVVIAKLEPSTDDSLDFETEKQLMVITINYHNGHTNIFVDEDICYNITVSYCDDSYLVTCMEERPEDLIVARYKIGDETKETEYTEAFQYDEDLGLCGRIILPDDPLTSDPEVDCLDLRYNAYFLVKKGDHVTCFDVKKKVFKKGYKDKVILIKRCNYFNVQNLWSDRFFLVFDDNFEEKKLKICIYDAKSLQFLYELPFPSYDIKAIKWNSDQSAFITVGLEMFTVIKLITEPGSK